MADIIFRTCRCLHEAEACADIEHISYGDQSWCLAEPEQKLLAKLLTGLQNVTIAELTRGDESRLAGFAVVFVYHVGTTLHGEVARLCVHPAARRRQIGSSLLKMVEARAAQTGVDVLRMKVHAESLGAQQFLRSQGWLADKVIGDHYRFHWVASPRVTEPESTRARFAISSKLHPC